MTLIRGKEYDDMTRLYHWRIAAGYKLLLKLPFVQWGLFKYRHFSWGYGGGGSSSYTWHLRPFKNMRPHSGYGRWVDGTYVRTENSDRDLEVMGPFYRERSLAEIAKHWALLLLYSPLILLLLGYYLLKTFFLAIVKVISAATVRVNNG